MTKHRDDSPHVRAFLSAPFVEAWLADSRLLQLLSMRRRVKELTEAVSAAVRVEAMLASHGVGPDGDGAVVFDCCSGKGLGAALLSFRLPKAR